MAVTPIKPGLGDYDETKQIVDTGPGGPVQGPQYAPPALQSVQPRATVPVVQLVEDVTGSPFVRGSLLGLVAATAIIGTLWWVTRSK